MIIKNHLLILILSLLFFSCTQDNDVFVSRNLQEFINENNVVKEDAIIAFAANAEANTSLVYIYYYPEVVATNVRYYELSNNQLDKDDFSNYRRQSLESASVFGGKLARFTRSNPTESWCLVTYFLGGELRISSPIKLQNATKTTQYSNEVAVNYVTTITPNFTWDTGGTSGNETYLQVLSDDENTFVSGTFTENTFFQYYDTSNVVENLNTTIPKDLVEDAIYNMTIMGISSDNWVNLIIEKQFIPRNLQEYVALHKDKNLANAFAFAASAKGTKETTYIYYLPTEDAFDFRYYETENTLVDETVFANYKRINLSSSVALGSKFRRFSTVSSKEVWCIVTYQSEGILHISEPIKTQNNTQPSEWIAEVAINYPETLQPVFTWLDGIYLDTEVYFQVFTTAGNDFLSGTFTKEKTFQYYNEANIVNDKIHTSSPPNLILDNEYKFTLFGLTKENWANLVIEKTFIAE